MTQDNFELIMIRAEPRENSIVLKSKEVLSIKFDDSIAKIENSVCGETGSSSKRANAQGQFVDELKGYVQDLLKIPYCPNPLSHDAHGYRTTIRLYKNNHLLWIYSYTIGQAIYTQLHRITHDDRERLGQFIYGVRGLVDKTIP